MHASLGIGLSLQSCTFFLQCVCSDTDKNGAFRVEETVGDVGKSAEWNQARIHGVFQEECVVMCKL